ncbi:MAG: HAD-IIIC family phosphatase [Acetatifactor sp.]|nr:HAD-IIIC family phosphatase [Acetatifactor sp.]
MTLQEVQDNISRNEYAKARKNMDVLKQEGYVHDDVMAILDASIYEALGDRENMLRSIREGLQYSCKKYELYYMLGCYYLPDNVDQAYLCFQNALQYCGQGEDAELIAAEMEELTRTGQVTVRNVAIVIVSYNICYMMQKNIESIRETLLPGTYQIIVIDNASEDGVRDWLREQPDIQLIENAQNVGFAPACNQAVRVIRESSDGQEDIFLLNNDTRLAPNALFWLRMGLYQDRRVGATGSLSNYAGNRQQLDIEFSLPGEYLDYGAKLNIPIEAPYEERVRLSGFAMLIKGHVWDETGGMDEAFAPGYFEDDDISMKILMAGYRLLLCRNSFVYHAGSQSFSHCQDVDELLVAHYQMFVQKYGFDILEHAYASDDVAGMPFSAEDAFNVLQIGSGLGADLKYIRSQFPYANVVGIETDEALYKVSQGTELIFRDLASAREVFRQPAFHVLLIQRSVYAGLSRTDRDILEQLCLKSCVILQEPPNGACARLEQVKLVIWDLDQTFWQGVLSEGGVSVLPDRVALVKDLTDCGIINSISSKNNEEEVLKVLEELGIAELFVFNDINWNNKGEQIQKKLENMHLRPENVLFIDDEQRNLEEGSYYNPGLMTAPPHIISDLCEYVQGLARSDLQHKRLEHYKILEKRREKEKSFLTREQFLHYSGIVLEIHQDCIKELDRIAELTARTNQLNFTKIRDGRDTLQTLLENKLIRSGYIKVRDRFGDYGVVGFYCFDDKNEKLRHFLFSCRIMGMGIAECVYSLLKAPKIEVIPPVAVRLDETMDTPWIKVDFVQADSTGSINSKSTGNENKIKVLLKGPCDMSTIESYLSGGDLTTEFNYVNDQGFITTGQNHSMHIWQSAMFSQEQIAALIEDVPFIVSGDFQTSIFSREYHVICYSLLPDCHTGLYRHRETGGYISFGSKNFDLTASENTKGYVDGSIVNHAFPFTEEIIARFARDWEFVGVTSGEDLIRNLDYMYTHAPGTPVFILLLGSEIEYEGINEEFANHAKHHKEINTLVKAYVKDKDRMRIIEMTDYIHSQDDYDDSINHFSRNVYYQLATALCACINEQVEKLKGKKSE